MPVGPICRLRRHAVGWLVLSWRWWPELLVGLQCGRSCWRGYRQRGQEILGFVGRVIDVDEVTRIGQRRVHAVADVIEGEVKDSRRRIPSRVAANRHNSPADSRGTQNRTPTKRRCNTSRLTFRQATGDITEWNWGNNNAAG